LSTCKVLVQTTLKEGKFYIQHRWS